MASLSLCHVIPSKSVSVFVCLLSLFSHISSSSSSLFLNQDVNQSRTQWQHTKESCCYNNWKSKQPLTKKHIGEGCLLYPTHPHNVSTELCRPLFGSRKIRCQWQEAGPNVNRTFVILTPFCKDVMSWTSFTIFMFLGLQYRGVYLIKIVSLFIFWYHYILVKNKRTILVKYKFVYFNTYWVLPTSFSLI